jgi:hypothetical protein
MKYTGMRFFSAFLACCMLFLSLLGTSSVSGEYSHPFQASILQKQDINLSSAFQVLFEEKEEERNHVSMTAWCPVHLLVIRAIRSAVEDVLPENGFYAVTANEIRIYLSHRHLSI